jgi:RES domain-containing protein
VVHDAELLDKLDALPKTHFDGEAFRATRENLDPLVSSVSGGRWMPPGGAPVLYTSLTREGALAEISFHWSHLDPRPTKPVVLHTLFVAARRILKLIRADLATLGVSETAYAMTNLLRTQQIGAAVEFLGCDGLIAPSARWACDNLILFADSMGAGARLEVKSSENIDWARWATEQGLIK